MSIPKKTSPISSLELVNDYPNEGPSLGDEKGWWIEVRKALLRRDELIGSLLEKTGNTTTGNVTEIAEIKSQLASLSSAVTSLNERFTTLNGTLIFLATRLGEINVPGSPDLSNMPTSNEKAALVGTHGLPSSTNKYMTDDDPRMVQSDLNYSLIWMNL